jgi:hypothetical protein
MADRWCHAFIWVASSAVLYTIYTQSESVNTVLYLARCQGVVVYIIYRTGGTRAAESVTHTTTITIYDLSGWMMDATSLLLSATSRLTPTCHDMMQIDVLLELLDKLLEQAEARELGHNFRSRGARCRKWV